jgi:hypothetical protein
MKSSALESVKLDVDALNDYYTRGLVKSYGQGVADGMELALNALKPDTAA